jgi:hypothetical protein
LFIALLHTSDHSPFLGRPRELADLLDQLVRH